MNTYQFKYNSRVPREFAHKLKMDPEISTALKNIYNVSEDLTLTEYEDGTLFCAGKDDYYFYLFSNKPFSQVVKSQSDVLVVYFS